MKKLILLRRISQIFFLTLFVYILWSTTYPLTGFLHPKIIFKIDPLIMFFTSFSERILLPGIGFALIMIVLTFILGRFFCGWVCPLGLMIDAVGALKKNKVIPSCETNRKLRKIKYFILGLIALSAVIGIEIAWIFDPMVTMARFVSLNFIPAVTLSIDKFFVVLIQTFHLYGPVYDFYRALKASFLGVNVYYFANSGIIFVFFLGIVSLAFIFSRLWCRIICPLGALYCLTAKPSLLERKVEKYTDKSLPKSYCRMGSIQDDMGYVKGECILCMDCVRKTPNYKTIFTWLPKRKKKVSDQKTEGGISRKDFLSLMISSLFFLGFKNRKRHRKGSLAADVIRPPGALKEHNFVDRCVRCGNCMKVCPTNGLQPTVLEAGLEGIWTPRLVPEIGYCEYNCTLCGNVCPTGAIPELSLEVKQKTKLGIAHIDKSICIDWANDEECIVCEEHCPVPDKAIKLKKANIPGGNVLRPVVNEELCIGCGICQTKCPTKPIRAIRMYEKGSQRT